MADEIKALSSVTSITLKGKPARAGVTDTSKTIFLERILDDVGGGAPASYTEFSVGTTSSTISAEDVAAVIRTAFIDALIRNTPEATFRSRLSKVGVDAAAVDVLATGLYRSKAATITAARRRVAENLNCGATTTSGDSADANTTTRGTLSNFDWTVSHVISSDKLATVAEPLVQLSLEVQQSSSSASNSSTDGQVVRMELGLEDLDAFISHLESAAGTAAVVSR